MKTFSDFIYNKCVERFGVVHAKRPQKLQDSDTSRAKENERSTLRSMGGREETCEGLALYRKSEEESYEKASLAESVPSERVRV